MIPKTAKIGWIGTGVMGKSMANHLISKGFNLSVFNRTASKADALVTAGAKFRPVKEIAADVDYLFLMLGYPHDVKQMLFCKNNGILNLMKPGSFLIDHTTSSPDLAA